MVGMKRIIVIAGPTASGKTTVSVALAKELHCSIISADSRQFYKELSIGTAKPTKTEMQGVPHYFIDSHSVQNPLSSGQFEKVALQKIEELFKKDNTVIVVGGSGMFIDALIYGTDNIPHDEIIRDKVTQQYKQNGIAFLQEQIKKVDPVFAQNADMQNPMRLIRAIEVNEITGKPFSSLKKREKKARFTTYYFTIQHPREVLYQRIDQRVDKMVNNGLFDEVKANMVYRHSQPLNTVGYKEIFDFFDGEITRYEAIELIKRNTRRYAKRQLTWFRREKEAVNLSYSNLSEMISLIQEKTAIN